MNQKNIDYSIIIPVYCNEDTIEECYEVLKRDVLDRNKDKSHEVIFVDDGSRDNSLERLLKVRKRNPESVKIIKFTRNFGQAFALLAGYKISRGACSINLSADLQDPPEIINKMLDSHFRDNYEIVIGTRKSREESFYRRATSSIFYRIMKILSFPNMPVGGFDFALISNRVKELIINEKNANPFWQGQIMQTGYRAKFIPYVRKSRKTSKSRWNFSRKIKYLIDGVMGYSYFPLRFMSVLGGIVALLGFLYAIEIAVVKISGIAILYKGWAPIMIIILILSGIQMMMLGIIGEYLWRTLDQVRGKELYIIEKIYD